MSDPLLIVGAGGFALEVLWMAECMNAADAASWRIVGLADDAAEPGIETDVPFLGKPAEAARRLGSGVFFHVAIGENAARLRVARDMLALGLKPASLVSPQAVISPDATLGMGIYVGPFAFVAPRAEVGNFVLVNVGAVVGHEAQIDAGAQLCPGAVVTGRCQIGQGAFLGSNASIPPGLAVGEWGRVSSNTFAAANVEPGITVASMPGRPMFKRA